MPPRVRDLVRRGGGLERAVGPAEQAGGQLLAAHAHVARARRRGRARASAAGRERVHVHHLLELVLLAGRVRVPVAPRPGAHQRPPERRHGVGAALGHAGQPVAVVRGLAAERHHAAGAQHAPELAEGGVQVGQVVEHGVADHEVEGLVLERQRSTPRRRRSRTLDAQARRGGREHARACRARCRWPRASLDHAGAHQVEDEVAGAGADLERAPEARRLARPAPCAACPTTWRSPSAS